MSRADYPAQIRANKAVTHAIAHGELPVPDRCAHCGATEEDVQRNHTPSDGKRRRRIQYHHPSYARGFELCVIALCIWCHEAVHGKRLADPGKALLATYLPPVGVFEVRPPHRAPTYGDLVRLLRHEAGLTRPEAAKRIGITTTSFVMYEHGGFHKPERLDDVIRGLGGSELDVESGRWLARRVRSAWHPRGPVWQGIPTRELSLEEQRARDTTKRIVRRRSAA